MIYPPFTACHQEVVIVQRQSIGVCYAWKKIAPILCLVMVVCACHLVVAAENRRSSSLAIDKMRLRTQYDLDIWQTSQGLPSDAILTILQTSDGYIWAGTFNGLVRFDGITFTLFNRSNTPQIKNNSIITLFEDSRRVLWIGVQEGGLIRYEEGVFTHFGKKDGLPDDIVRSFAEDADGALLIGTNKGVVVMRGKHFEPYHSSAKIANERVNALSYHGLSKTLRIGTDAGIVEVSPTSYRAFRDIYPRAAHTITCMLTDNTDTLWIATRNGLYTYHKGQYRQFSRLDTSISVRSLYQESNGTLWIGTEQGLFVWQPNGVFERLGVEDGLSDVMVYGITQDKEGSLWFGTYYGGINRFKKQKFRNITKREGLLGNVVYSMIQASDSSLWIATLGGLQRYYRGTFTNFSRTNGLASEEVRAVVEDRTRRGRFWVTTYNGLHEIIHNTVQHIYTSRHGLAGEKIRTLCQTRDGALWIGTTKGLTRFQSGQCTNYTIEQGLGNNSIMALLEDSTGRLWIGTDGGGVSVLERGVVKTFGIQEGLAGQIIFALHEDRLGAIWVGTKFGLHRIFNNTIVRITTKEGLQSDDILQILQSDNGVFWIGTSVGIMTVSANELQDCADGKRTSVSCHLYNRFDGLITNNCTAPAFPTITPDGCCWFPTLKGLTVIDPYHIPVNTLPPPVRIEQVQIDSQIVTSRSHISLPAGTEKFTIQYAALSFVVPERVRFKYRLEGFDKAWVDAGLSRTAYYTRLSPGEYTFRVIACNNDNVWNEVGVSLTIQLEPFFYQTWWFYVLCSVVLLGVAIGSVRRHTRNLAAQKRYLEGVVDERTRELRRSNAKIQSQLELLDAQAQKITSANKDLEHRNEALAALNQEKNEILGIVAHDLKNPIGAIRGLAELIENGSVEKEQLEQVAEQIVKSSNRIMDLVTNLLDINRLEQGGFQMNPCAVDIMPIVEGCIVQYQEIAVSKNIVLQYSNNATSSIVFGDEQAIMQVFDNLISNALKYSPLGKKVFVRILSQSSLSEEGRASLAMSHWSNDKTNVPMTNTPITNDRVTNSHAILSDLSSITYLRLEVQDEGPGISEDDMKKLFGKFARLSARPTGGEHSTGLGLSIVKKMVEVMNGRVWCESELGKGATFIVELPAA